MRRPENPPNTRLWPREVRLPCGSRSSLAATRAAYPGVAHLAAKKSEKPPKKGESPARSAAKVSEPAAKGKASAPARVVSKPQPRLIRTTAAVSDYERAMGVLGKHDWKGALERFREFEKTYPNEAELLDRVRTYIRVCERSLKAAPAQPKTAEEHYQAGVLRLNQGSIEEAARHFGAATALDDSLDKARYAMAAALALKDERAGALEHLRRAIELNPDNRVFAANDSDLESLRDDPEFVELVGRTRKGRREARPADADESE